MLALYAGVWGVQAPAMTAVALLVFFSEFRDSFINLISPEFHFVSLSFLVPRPC